MWDDWKKFDSAKTLKMLREAEKDYLVPGIEEDVIPTSKIEENIPVHVIPDEGERVRPNEISDKSSDLTYLNKDADADTSAYDRVLNGLEKLDKLYNPMMHNMHKPVIEGNYNVTGDTRVIPIVEHEDGQIQNGQGRIMSPFTL